MDEKWQVLIPESRLKERVKQLAEEISAEYKGKELTIVAILSGSLIFLGDLVKSLAVDVRTQVIKAASYGNGMRPQGEVTLETPANTGRPYGRGEIDVAGKEVLILDDIVDTGRTLEAVQKFLRNLGPKSLKTCALLSKPARRKVAVKIDFLGFEIEDKFVVGYGLDYAGKYRNLPFIAALEKESNVGRGESSVSSDGGPPEPARPSRGFTARGLYGQGRRPARAGALRPGTADGRRRTLLPLLIVLALLSFCGCAKDEERKLRLATTTSVENSGLLDAFLPEFERKFAVKVQVTAVGTGRALELARAGDSDVVIVHAPGAEQDFLKKGFGINRETICYNYFLILGPPSDPAGAEDAKTAQEAFLKIAESNALFISRGDNSGTHTREKKIWQTAGIKPEGHWYLETGQAMGPSLLIADEKRAYTLSDRATYLSYKNKLELVPHYSSPDEILYNPYSIIATNPAKHSGINYKDTLTLINWLTSEEGQRLITEYLLDKQVLFYPYEDS